LWLVPNRLIRNIPDVDFVPAFPAIMRFFNGGSKLFLLNFLSQIRPSPAWWVLKISAFLFSEGRGPLSFQHGDLLPQSEDFKRGIHATAEEHADGSQECGDSNGARINFCDTR
jgi:hypothetical protein